MEEGAGDGGGVVEADAVALVWGGLTIRFGFFGVFDIV